jgi:hypothetical protein
MSAWYEGKDIEEALAVAHVAELELWEEASQDNYTDLAENVILNTSITDDSHYLLECYRSRSIYGDSPTFNALVDRR